VIHSPEINEIAAALARAWPKFKSPERSAVNPQFRSSTSGGKYATLEDVLDAVRDPLAVESLMLSQSVTTYPETGLVSVHSMLMHKSGQFLRFETTLPTRDYTAHGCGAAVTYARRYSAMAILNLAPGDGTDDDGNAATIVPVREPAGKRNADVRPPSAPAGSTGEESVAVHSVQEAVTTTGKPYWWVTTADGRRWRIWDRAAGGTSRGDVVRLEGVKHDAKFGWSARRIETIGKAEMGAPEPSTDIPF
jgi:hypothetical protein